MTTIRERVKAINAEYKAAMKDYDRVSAKEEKAAAIRRLDEIEKRRRSLEGAPIG